MRLNRRALLASSLTLPWGAHSQTSWKPSQPVRLVIPFAAGSTMEPVARLIEDYARVALAVPFIIDYKPGAGTVIGAQEVLRSRADGHTLLMIANSFSANITLRADKTAGWLNAFHPLVQTTIVPQVLVTSSKIASSFSEFIKYCKSSNQAITYGSPGIGTSIHLGAEQFSQLAGIKAEHAPYNGFGQLIADIKTGRIQFMFSNLPDALVTAKEGTLKPLAIAAQRRSPEMPDVPTLGEVGFPQVLSDTWFGVVMRSDTPEAAKIFLERFLLEAMLRAETKLKLEGLGFQVLARPSKDFSAEIQKYVQVYAEVIRRGNIHVD